MEKTVSQKYIYAVWRRKSSTAVLKLFPHWKWKINFIFWEKKVTIENYFWWNNYLIENSLYPFYLLWKDEYKNYDADVYLKWWWIRWQSDALRLAFSRALIQIKQEIRTSLKPFWLLKRDPRIKERNKPWLRKARKSPQWSKR